MTPITFHNPALTLLLLLLVPLAVLLRRARCRRNVVLSEMGADESLRRSVWPDRLRIFAVTLLIVAVARPGYSPQRHSISKRGRDVVFVLDVSRSMLAEDAYPSRLEAAKNGIRDALDHFQTERAGLVIYAGSANILCPLTYDHDFVRFMLDQAMPRAVDFGGTTLLSAVEKCTGSMLSDDRKGMQDLIVLTDGEDHDTNNRRVAQLLRDHELGLIVIGIGDASSGSRIPIEDEQGKRVYLEHDGRMVTTRLNDEGLRELASLAVDAAYRPIGTAGYDLGTIYTSYVINKPVSGTSGSDTYIVYHEAAFGLIALALVLLLLAERMIAKPHSLAIATLIAYCAVSGTVAKAADPQTAQRFAEAMQLHQQGRHTDAFAEYELLEKELPFRNWTLSEIAVLKFNQGLCRLAEAEANATLEPRTALSMAHQAQAAFLAARRMSPSFRRPAMRLDSTARLIADYQARIQEEEARNRQFQDQMQQLVERLRELQRKQSELQNDVPSRPNPPARRRRDQSASNPAPTVREPETAGVDSKRFADRQRAIRQEGVEIEKQMQTLDQAMLPPGTENREAPTSILAEPLRFMKEVIATQELATTMLAQWGSWHDARNQQQLAVQKIQEILDLLASDDSEESDESEWDEEEEDWDMMEPSDSDPSMSESMQGQGDFSSDAAMQPLPVPNYSVDDILQQERGNLQFRQQQRAQGNQKSVEKDW
ncbi:vWA domain-containing protein [Novipirellula artificiosorum]|uniref:von Willebrand factor type A domain protein n=1 Tax=Novipirellula artificiosorum TaxID=2528016 RepID=A0A5C6DQT4_9BACT|nr:VWA domain-containing protein [Novipirellula artificiosorum]TWU38217.1 von Willebrand factor type A domain protein [Novipirellula artificiosorum]